MTGMWVGCSLDFHTLNREMEFVPMLDERELATLLAALLSWREEITSNGNRSAAPYLKSVGMAGIEPLSVAEIGQLSRRVRRWNRSS